MWVKRPTERYKDTKKKAKLFVVSFHVECVLMLRGAVTTEEEKKTVTSVWSIINSANILLLVDPWRSFVTLTLFLNKVFCGIISFLLNSWFAKENEIGKNNLIDVDFEIRITLFCELTCGAWLKTAKKTKKNRIVFFLCVCNKQNTR